MTDDHRLLAKLSRRVEAVTGLSTKLSEKAPHAEEMQILNYGLGGMYTPHHDFLVRSGNILFILFQIILPYRVVFIVFMT
jgi:hypothetical protein